VTVTSSSHKSRSPDKSAVKKHVCGQTGKSSHLATAIVRVRSRDSNQGQNSSLLSRKVMRQVQGQARKSRL